MAGILLFGAPFYEGFVASRALMLKSKDATNTQLMSRTALVAAENLSSVKLVVANFIPGNPDTGAGGTVTETWSIEYPSGTIAAQIKFGGNSSVDIPDATSAVSDYASVSIPAGETFWARCYSTCSSGVLYNNWQSIGFSEQCAVATSGLSDQTMIGSSISGGTSKTYTHPPLAVIGRTINASALIIGDSRTDAASSHDGKNGNISPSMGDVPFVNIAVGGATAQNWISQSTGRSVLMPYGSQVIVSLGVNDAGSRTSAQIASSVSGILAAASAPKKYVCTIEPYTTSSDSWSTVGNQTLKVPHSAVMSAYNDLVRSGISGATGYYESADVAESARNSGKWIASPSPPYTADGLHGNAAFNTLLANSGAIVPASYP